MFNLIIKTGSVLYFDDINSGHKNIKSTFANCISNIILALYISKLYCTYLQKQSGSFAVILLGSNMEGRETNFTPGVILQKHCNNLLMFLLHCHGQRGEPILKQTPLSHNFAKVLLSLQPVNKLCKVL